MHLIAMDADEEQGAATAVETDELQLAAHARGLADQHRVAPNVAIGGEELCAHASAALLVGSEKKFQLAGQGIVHLSERRPAQLLRLPGGQRLR